MPRLLPCTLCAMPLALVAMAAADPDTDATSRPVTRPVGRAVRFADGVTLNWPQRQVEIDAEVVLRDGVLELFACSPGTKEHESILRIDARPLHVYQALGLLGLPDGRPPWFDEKARRVIPPKGTPVDVRVRYRRDGRTLTDDARDWMESHDPPGPLPPSQWYFIAAAPAPGERFGADLYGTVVTVVQFGTAIVMLAPRGAIHAPNSTTRPADAAALDDETHVSLPGEWVLIPRDDRVPPVGTKVTLIIRPAAPALRASLDRFGRVHLDGRTIDPAALAEAASAATSADPNAQVVLLIDPDALPRDVDRSIDALRAAGLDPARVDRRISPTPAFPENDPAAAADLLIHQFALHRSLWRDVSIEAGRVVAELDRRRDLFQRTMLRFEQVIERWGDRTAPSEPRGAQHNPAPAPSAPQD